jgi:hypothetical protein
MTISSIGSLSGLCNISVVFWGASWLVGFPIVFLVFFLETCAPLDQLERGKPKQNNPREKKAVEQNLMNDEYPKRKNGSSGYEDLLEA